MRTRWIPVTLLLLSAAMIAATIKLTYHPLTVWYAKTYVIDSFLAQAVTDSPSDTTAPDDVDRTVARLQKLGSTGVEAVLQKLREESPGTKRGLWCWLLFFGVVQNVPDSLPLLLAEADSDSASVRAAVAAALGRYWEPDDRIMTTLDALRNDGDENVRNNAKASLVFIDVDIELTRLALNGGTVSMPDDKTDTSNKLILPDWWNHDDPTPIDRSNCVRCHLTAGRELTAPVRDFARSAHDRAKMSCNDCHGGNTHDDTKAHEHEFDFIGTKLSAHIAACADCHTDEAEAFRKGSHFWDLSKRINRDYPVCIDCHGNHDVGKPPADFSLTNVCTDCHKHIEENLPDVAAVVAENDRLWKVLRGVHAKNKSAADPTPVEFRRELAAVRRSTARLVHPAGQISKEQSESLNRRARQLRERLETWLKDHQ